jgi:hypothetical protein
MGKNNPFVDYDKYIVFTLIIAMIVFAALVIITLYG